MVEEADIAQHGSAAGLVQHQIEPFIVSGIDAAGQTLEEAGLIERDEAARPRAGCSIGSGIGGLPGTEIVSLVLANKGLARISPHFEQGRLVNLISGQVSIKYELMGPNHAVVTACSTGAHSIGDAVSLSRARLRRRHDRKWCYLWSC